MRMRTLRVKVRFLLLPRFYLLLSWQTELVNRVGEPSWRTKLTGWGETEAECSSEERQSFVGGPNKGRHWVNGSSCKATSPTARWRQCIE